MQELVDDHDPMLRGCLARLQTYVATPEVVPDLTRAAADFPDVRGDCVVAIAHSGSALPAELPIGTWLSTTRDPVQRSQLMYAMGMSRHPAVDELADDHSHPMQRFAQWWRVRGGAITDTPEPAYATA